MKRDKALNVFLFFVLTAELFICFCPVYFAYGAVHIRSISLPERFYSLLVILLWLTLSIYSAWKKRLPLLVGGLCYSLMAYLPGWILPHLTQATGSTANSGISSNLLKFIFERMYELTNAPMVGISLLVSTKTAQGLSKMLLPVLLACYAGAQLFRFYRNAYLAAQLHIEDTAYASNPELAHALAIAPIISTQPAGTDMVISADPAGLIALDRDSSESDASDGQTHLRIPGLH